MKTSILFSLALSIAALAATAADKKPKADLARATFYIENIQCMSCVDSITGSLTKLPTIGDIDGLSGTSGYATISFDPKTVSHHQVANAIYKAEPVHGDAYMPSLKVRIPDYAKAGNAAKIDALLAAQKDVIEVKPINKAKGEFRLAFLQLKLDPKKKGPQGFDADAFAHSIQDPAPKGLCLELTWVME